MSEIAEIVVTYADGRSLTLSRDTYGLHMAIEQWLAGEGYGLIVASVTADASRCPRHRWGKHRWEGRRVVGIPFRRCSRCTKVQRNLYSTSWEDFPTESGYPASVDAARWDGSVEDGGIEPCSPADLRPGMQAGYR